MWDFFLYVNYALGRATGKSQKRGDLNEIIFTKSGLIPNYSLKTFYLNKIYPYICILYCIVICLILCNWVRAMSNAENVSNDTQIENNNIIPETTGTNAEAGNTEPTATAPSETTVEASAPVAVAEEAAAPTTASGSDSAPVPAELDEAAKAAAAAKQKKFDEAFEKIKAARDNNTEIEVVVKDRIRGGLRVMFEEIPIFLPASHFSLKRNPSEEELKEVIGATLKVKIHELETDETKGKAVIVSRKQILEDDFWNTIKIGDVVEGPVSSIASFGIFLDLGGVEGLIHISRLSQTHVADTKTFAKKGQMMKASVVELDRTKNRIALSSKDLEESPWKDAEAKFAVGSKVKGIVRRLTDFGAYVEVAQGIGRFAPYR